MRPNTRLYPATPATTNATSVMVVTTYSLPTPVLQEISLSRTRAKNPAATATRLIAVWKTPRVVKPSIHSPYARRGRACNLDLGPTTLLDGDAKQVTQSRISRVPTPS